VKSILLLATVAVIFGVSGIFFGHMLAHSDEPAVVVRNLTRVTIPQVKIETDVGESHALAEMPSHRSLRLRISGRDKSLWIVAKLADGRELTSEKIYVTSQGVVFAVISEDDIDLEYQL
jgi:hypothetical protein